MSCDGVFDLEAIETLAPTTAAGVFDLSGKSWLVLQAAMVVIADYGYWCGEYGSGNSLLETERQAIDGIVSEIQQRIDEVVTLGTMAEQNADAVAITGGTVDGVVIGATVRADASVDNLVVRPTVTNGLAVSAETQCDIVNTVYGNAAGDTPGLAYRRAKGTRLTPTGVILNDRLGDLKWSGYHGAGFGNGAFIRAVAIETWNSGARGTKLEWYTVQAGTTTPAVGVTLHDDKRLELEGTLDHDGSLIGLNGSTPVAKGTITGSRGGNDALASLLTYLASRGDIIDNSTA